MSTPTLWASGLWVELKPAILVQRAGDLILTNGGERISRGSPRSSDAAFCSQQIRHAAGPR